MKKIFPKSSQIKAPVLFLIFNRPDCTKLVFETIRKYRPRRLYISSDGPRKKYGIKEKQQVEIVRNIATAVDWPCRVKKLFHVNNLGCGPAIKKAIDWFFKNEKKGIILEDDTIPTKYFYSFCEELLKKYENDNRIGMIAGTNDTGYKAQVDSYVFSKKYNTWGWATWRRAWLNMDFSMKWKNNSKNCSNILKNISHSKSAMNNWKAAISHIDKNLVSAWDWQWFFSLASQNQLCITPCVNLIENVGFGESATHTKEKHKYINKESKISKMTFPLTHPKYFCPDHKYELYFEKKKFQNQNFFINCIPNNIKFILKNVFLLISSKIQHIKNNSKNFKQL